MVVRFTAHVHELDVTSSGEVPATYEGRRGFEMQRLPHHVADTIREAMDKAGVSQRDLARTLRVSESRVSQVLSGEENLTLRTLASVSAALGFHFTLTFEPFTAAETGF
jgi:antitoxin component HigA of HigAB toxin-antitoxin module